MTKNNRTVQIPLEEYEELKRFKDNADIGQWYSNFNNGYSNYNYEPETESIKKLNKQNNKLKERLEKYRTRPTMKDAKQVAERIVAQVKEENKQLKEKIKELEDGCKCRKNQCGCSDSKVSNFWSSWF